MGERENKESVRSSAMRKETENNSSVCSSCCYCVLIYHHIAYTLRNYE